MAQEFFTQLSCSDLIAVKRHYWDMKGISLRVCFKELVHEVMGPGKSEICRAAGKLETQVGFLWS